MTPTTSKKVSDAATIQYRDEVVRKLIHLFSLSIPIIYYYIDRTTAIIILSALAAFALLVELLRYYSKDFSGFFYKFFGFMLRKHEVDSRKKNLNGATYVLLSALLCIVIFPKLVFITAFSILIISDSVAALVGRKIGKTKFLMKSLEGTLAFFVSATLVILLAPKVNNEIGEYVIGIIAAAIGAIVENISFGIVDDNLSIPISVGVVMLILYALMYPGVQLILSNVPL